MNSKRRIDTLCFDTNMNHFYNYDSHNLMIEYKFLLHDISLEKRQSKFVSCDHLVIKKIVGLNIHRTATWKYVLVFLRIYTGWTIYVIQKSLFRVYVKYFVLCLQHFTGTFVMPSHDGQKAIRWYFITVRFFTWVKNIRESMVNKPYFTVKTKSIAKIRT